MQWFRVTNLAEHDAALLGRSIPIVSFTSVAIAARMDDP